MITEKDKQFLASKGISEARLNEQLKAFQTGFPYLQLDGAATVGNGILRPTPQETEASLEAWNNYLADNHKVVKFVPASGAASRMFKDLFAYLDQQEGEAESAFVQTFFEKLPNAAFYADLDAACIRLYGANIPTLIKDNRRRDIVSALLNTDGLGYGKLPKGLLKFHSYGDEARTPAEEHLVEGALYAKDAQGNVRVHFTVSPEHRALFQQLVDEKREAIASRYEAKIDVSFSEQKSSTDTVAANPDNTPFRQADGSMLFRPGGHGALIENLNDIDADVVFIKNIDNVVPDRLKDTTVKNKKLLAGILVRAQQQIFTYLEDLNDGMPSPEELNEMLSYLENTLCCRTESNFSDQAELADYLYTKFNRPLRVCGMVKNVGEPGGGPFRAYNADGTVSLQILESSQIDMADAAKKAMFEGGTHFNPVDLVCGLRDFRGKAFNLPEYVDPKTGFISHKSKDGRELKALELPGLWNGAMSDWNTIFVEVPLETFNPVKTVNDLYREQHQ